MTRSSTARGFSFAAAVLVLSLGGLGCGDDGASAVAPAECAAGGRRCGEGGAVEVCVMGRWAVVGDCAEGLACVRGECEPVECEPACEGRECGADGCGGECGVCEHSGCGTEGRCGPWCGDGGCDAATGEDCATCPADCGPCCGDGSCEEGESCTTCPADCGSCCGNETCEEGEDCATCPADCGACCGDEVCAAELGENCATCAADCGCGAGEECDGEPGICRPGCQPQCDERVCGDDGCGGVCGRCEGGRVCSGAGECVEAPPACGTGSCDEGEDCATCPADCGACCGDDECTAAQGENCATCPADCGCPEGEVCDLERRVCEPGCLRSCEERHCGDDGCGGSCGSCEGLQLCSAEGRCVDPGPDCGDGGCDLAGGEDCATCPADCACPGGQECDVEQRACQPVCAPNCDARECGPDGCGGNCGSCEGAQLCSAAGQCVELGPDCGDGNCDGEAGEGCATCPADCGACCGDGSCDTAGGEDCARCPADCGACCGDGVCDAAGGETCASCPADCGACCGDAACDGGRGEDCASCPLDCGCGAGQECDLEQRICSLACQRVCGGRECGADGCGGFCGLCEGGAACDAAGQCVPLCQGQCDGRDCGPDGCGGSCGECGPDQLCGLGGRCIGGGPTCDCAEGEICVEGVCRAPALVCSAEAPNGLCPNGQDCVAGVCRDAGVACSDHNPTGVCPVGEICRNGGCQPFDAEVLCDDGNACTLDYFDYQRNRCVHPAREAACDDGNACTLDGCLDGVCVADPIDGCVAPPVLGPFTSPTNEVQLVLTGTKPADASVEINGEEAVAENPAEVWSVTLNLVPGENLYAIRTVDGGGASAAVEIRVVYDITPPNTRVSPLGGSFLDGVTVTAASDEPATVYYTSDGSEPDEWSASFHAAHTFRVFDSTTLRFRARDLAGNWEASVVSAAFEISGEDNRWQPGATLAAPRSHVAVAAGDGSIFVVGGTDGAASQASATAYRYAERTWVDLPPLPAPRTQLALVRHGGMLYALGGEDDELPLNSVTRLSDGAAAWTLQRAMPSTRFGLQAVSSGQRIYVFGGKTNGGVVLDTLEVYDPVADTWTNQVAQMPRPRYGFAALLLEGRVYLLGGEDEQGAPIAAVDVYVVQENRWESVADLPTPRSFPAATLTWNSGSVTGGATGLLVSGGRLLGGSATALVEEYLLEEQRWVRRTPLPRPRHSAAGVTVVAPGLVDDEQTQGWVIGGQEGAEGAQLSTSLLYFAREQDYARHLGPLPEGRFLHAAVPLNDRIYLIGGRYFQETLQGWSFDPETDTYAPIADLPSVQSALAAVALQGSVWAVGGANSFGNAVPTLRSYDPITDQWRAHQPMLNARIAPAAVALDDRIYVIGGDNGGALQTVEAYDPATDRWQSLALLPQPRAGAVAAAHHGTIYVAGGVNAEGAAHTTILRLRDERWDTLPAAPISLVNGRAALLRGQLTLLAGRVGGSLSRQTATVDLDTGQQSFPKVPSSSLLAPLDLQAAATLNGEIYLFGGNENPQPGPSGLSLVQKLAGRCFDGVAGPYETQASAPGIPDAGGGCGQVDPLVNLNPGHAYARHGSCNSWNGCGSAAACAQFVCTFFGYGDVDHYRTTNDCDSTAGQVCDVFASDGSRIQDYDWSGCALPAVYDIVCWSR